MIVRGENEPDPGARLATAVQALIGTPFRPGGRDPSTGLDCFGVLDAGLRAIGRSPSLPSLYRQRRLGLPDLAPWLVANGLVATAAPGRPGDILLLHCGPAQPHCAILTARGFVHAHAGIGRVVETPGEIPWPTIARARLATPPQGD